MGNEVLIPVRSTDETAPTREKILADWKSLVKAVLDMPLRFTAVDETGEARTSAEKGWYELADVVSNTPVRFTAEDGTAPTRDKVELGYYELAESLDAQPLVFTAVNGTGDAINSVESTYNQVADQVEARPVTLDAVNDTQPVLDEVEANVRELAAEVAATPIRVVADLTPQQESLPSGSTFRQLPEQTMPAVDYSGAAADIERLSVAYDAAGEASQTMATGEKAATAAAGGMRDAMGPLWMIMNVAQIAMFGLYSTMGNTSTAAQDVSQQIINLGRATGSSAAGLLANNQALQQANDDLTAVGSSSAEFASKAQQGFGAFTSYAAGLSTQMDKLGGTMVNATESAQTYSAQGQQSGQIAYQQTMSIAALSAQIGSSKTQYNQLSPAVADMVTQYRNLQAVMPELKSEEQLLAAQQQVTNDQISVLLQQMPGVTGMASAFGQSIGGVAAEWQAFATANPTGTVDQISMAFDQANLKVAQSETAITTTFQQADQAARQAAQGVVSAQHSEAQAADSVAAAQHGVTTALEGLASAEHGAQQAQQSYNQALDQERSAQQAVADARRAAVQQLIDLNLQANDAAAGALGANVSLYDAQKAAAALGVNPGNAQAIAAQQITDANEAQVKAADALINAENQVADAQNNSKKAQDSLGTARRQGVDGNPQVLSAEKSLQQATDQVSNAQYALRQAQQQVTSAEYAVRQAHDQVSNALWAQNQAAQAVTSAQNALRQAEDNASRSLDINTAAGQRNIGLLLSLNSTMLQDNMPTQQRYNTLVQDAAIFFGGSRDAAANYLKQLGLIPQDFRFGVSAVASVDMGAIQQIEHDYHISATTQRQAVGGPSHGGLTWVGEQGAELVRLPAGSSVMPHSNSMIAAASGDAPIPHRAAGGPASLVAANVVGASLGEMYQSSAEAAHVMGLPFQPPLLPQYVPPAMSFGPVGGVRGNAAANRALMFNIFASMFGWGSPAEQNATDYLMMRESGYNNMAQNPTSTAFGQFQFLDSTWSGYGIGKTADPGQQDVAGGRYIHARYGDPIGAANHERAYSWYGAGGISGGGGWIGVGEHGPELLRVPGGSSVRPSPVVPTSQPEIKVTVDFTGTGRGIDAAMAEWVMEAMRTGKIRVQPQWVHK